MRPRSGPTHPARRFGLVSVRHTAKVICDVDGWRLITFSPPRASMSAPSPAGPPPAANHGAAAADRRRRRPISARERPPDTPPSCTSRDLKKLRNMETLQRPNELNGTGSDPQERRTRPEIRRDLTRKFERRNPAKIHFCFELNVDSGFQSKNETLFL